MKHILFNNAAGIGGSSRSYTTVDPNLIYLFDISTKTSLNTTVEADGVDNFMIVQTDENSNIVFQTPILARENIERVKTTDYVAPDPQVTTLGAFPNPVTGTEYSVKVVDVTNGYEPYPVQTATVVATSAIDTAAKLIIALRDAFNNNSRSLVTATSTSTTLVLTGAIPSLQTQEGIYVGGSSTAQSFSTSLSEELAGVTLTPTAAPVFGTGSYNHVRYLEENSQAGQGFLYRATPFQAEKPVFYSDPTLTYDLVSILYRTNTTPNIAKSNKYVEYILAYNTAAGLAANWQTVFGF